MRRTIAIILVILAVLAAGFIFYRQRRASQEASFEILRQATVERDRIQATVNATGSIEPEAFLSLTFGAAGMVQKVNVVRGQTVQTGDVLATLNAEELALLRQQAEDTLSIQELTLAQRRDGEPT
ncbi:MAG TPA: biotin/lipoyl-binding protein, partial [Candidatus Binatia bacterium]|nr:biotin/lipoyl-binding protein [Candidatus Binatia bacterium]